ncbi:MAG: hypothetical protein J7621_22735 [Niastella sp.]|nr:hypothetical protein [Niastella sp.]
MLQNRVDPLGNLIRASARGAWMGNRGVLHNEQQEIVRPFKLQAWIICKLEFKGRKRPIMKPNHWTELFFLDEATAFAAGHRPCFECRREAATHFKSSWIKGNPLYKFNMKTPIGEIDKILHKERRDGRGEKRTFKSNAANLPDGTFVTVDKMPYLLKEKQLFLWTPSGYKQHMAITAATLTVLTPRSVVEAFRAGYKPQMGL